jgi:L-ascorbate metabolism protein UlaG (beta-lactamase superfamily)
MQITWLGHASFRISIGGQVLLIDPWLTGNPLLAGGKARGPAVDGATAYPAHPWPFRPRVRYVLELARALGVPVVGI